MDKLPKKFRSIEDLKPFVNSHKYKMEIGASKNPLCNGINTIFVDWKKDSLLNTVGAIDIHKTTTFMIADAGNIPIESSSMDCIVSAYFSWNCNDEYRLKLMIEILAEWGRIIKNSGHIIIVSSKSCIGDIEQICDLIGLHIINISNKERQYYTLILQRI